MQRAGQPLFLLCAAVALGPLAACATPPSPRPVALDPANPAAAEAPLPPAPNGMFLGLFQLLAVKQAEVDAQRGYLEALRDYWVARAELTRTVGGRLPAATPAGGVAERAQAKEQQPDGR